MNKNWIPIDSIHVSWAMSVCPSGSFARLNHEEIPSFVPSTLREKCFAAVLMGSGISHDRAVYVLNLRRRDGSDVDQQPILFVAALDTQATSGYVYQHGGWDGRSSPTPAHFDELIAASGMMAAMAWKGQAVSGQLTELVGTSDVEAFSAAARKCDVQNHFVGQ